MSNFVVGLTGRKRSGKDTFAARLIELGFTRVSLADPLREVVLTINPWVRVETDELGILYGPGSVPDAALGDYARLVTIVKAIGWERAKEIREVRRLLQVTGTDAVRNIIGDTAWTEVAARAIDAVDGPVVITDVRFPNEAKIVDKVVRIVRPGLPEGDLHPSETAMDDFPVDGEVANDGTIDDLNAKADFFVLDHLDDLPAASLTRLAALIGR